MDTPDSPEPKRRLSLTKAQLREEIGAALLDILKSITGDGELTPAEIEQLTQWLQTNSSSEIPAVAHLAAILKRVLADGFVSPDERLELQLGIEKVLPVTERGFAKAARESAEQKKRAEKITRVDLEKMVKDSAGDDEEREENEEEEFYRKARRDWRNDAMTDRQRDYIFALGSSIPAGATKGEASDAIEALLGQRPPTSRQLMVLRFWGRSQEAGEGPGEISDWQDRFYREDPDRKHAWELFKEESNDDGRQGDPNRVPFGVGPEYLVRIKSGRKNPSKEPAAAEPPAERQILEPNFENAKEEKSYVGVVAVGFTIILVILGLLIARQQSPRLPIATSRPQSTVNGSPAQPKEEELTTNTVIAVTAAGVREIENRAPLESTIARRVAALKVAGFIGGSRPRVLIDGKLFAEGEIVDAATSLSVQSIDMRESSVLFVDGSGIIYTRSLK